MQDARATVVGSDHYLRIGDIGVKFRRVLKKKTADEHFNSQGLSELAVRENFAIEHSN